MKLGTPDHPKMRLLARTLGIPRAQAVGIMEMLWHWVREYAPQGDIGKWEDDEIAAAADWDGPPTVFVDALVDSGWLDRSDDDDRLFVHDWSDHRGGDE